MKDETPNFSEKLGLALRESSALIVITGARGWVGQACLEMIERALGDLRLPRECRHPTGRVKSGLSTI